jgi:hypothetical protein
MVDSTGGKRANLFEKAESVDNNVNSPLQVGKCVSHPLIHTWLEFYQAQDFDKKSGAKDSAFS